MGHLVFAETMLHRRFTHINRAMQVLWWQAAQVTASSLPVRCLNQQSTTFVFIKAFCQSCLFIWCHEIFVFVLFEQQRSQRCPVSLFLPCLICSVIVGCFIDMHFFILNTVFHHCCDFFILFKVLFTFHNLFQFDIYIQRTYIAYIDIYRVMVITQYNTTSIVYTRHKSNQSYMYG